uniref:Uncharacterized protein n=1 Tax=mine drainage metagenome TaxID=410659 RepID=E6PHX5_9ZZZZ
MWASAQSLNSIPVLRNRRSRSLIRLQPNYARLFEHFLTPLYISHRYYRFVQCPILHVFY